MLGTTMKLNILIILFSILFLLMMVEIVRRSLYVFLKYGTVPRVMMVVIVGALSTLFLTNELFHVHIIYLYWYHRDNYDISYPSHICYIKNTPDIILPLFCSWHYNLDTTHWNRIVLVVFNFEGVAVSSFQLARFWYW